MLALSQPGWRQWLMAKALGMPRPKNYGVFTFIRSGFSPEITDRIQFGYERMAYLCGEKWAGGTPGGEFAHAMMHHREWGRELRVQPWKLYAPNLIPGEAAAREFLNKVWPRGEVVKGER